jgi:hypothetical protein
VKGSDSLVERSEMKVKIFMLWSYERGVRVYMIWSEGKAIGICRIRQTIGSMIRDLAKYFCGFNLTQRLCCEGFH